MKNILWIISLFAFLNGFTSCEYPWVDHDYPYTSVYFVNQYYNRNVIIGEGLQIGVGISFSGVVDNKEERTATLAVDPALVIEEDKSVLPPDYYTVQNNFKIVIPKGSYSGYLPVTLDSVKFLNDPKAVSGEYVLPMRIVSVSKVDSINEEKDYICISLSYLAKQFGNYQYSGDYFKYFDGVVFSYNAFANLASDNNSFRFLETTGPTTFRMVADARNPEDPALNVQFFIHLETRGTAVTIESAPESTYEVLSTPGLCNYNPEKRRIHLEYSWIDENDVVNEVIEDLDFRNRIYDVQSDLRFINEWRGDF